ncbi:MAG: hypothetical protein ABSB29_09680 [Nitrososphaerales archaeon]
MLSVSLERVTEQDLVSMLFNREDSRLAARTFVGWLKRRNGRCSKKEMSGFSHDLASGRLGVKLSRTNFYKTILARFIDLGLVAEDLVYDPEARKAVKAYHVVVQPVSGRRPTSPSLLFLAHVVSERWNQEIFESSASLA